MRLPAALRFSCEHRRAARDVFLRWSRHYDCAPGEGIYLQVSKSAS
jgi:hypothetical protein